MGSIGIWRETCLICLRPELGSLPGCMRKKPRMHLCTYGLMPLQAAPPKTFTVHEEDDGWETIQDAQNAAALFVLFSVSTRCTPLQALPFLPKHLVSAFGWMRMGTTLQ